MRPPRARNRRRCRRSSDWDTWQRCPWRRPRDVRVWEVWHLVRSLLDAYAFALSGAGYLSRVRFGTLTPRPDDQDPYDRLEIVGRRSAKGHRYEEAVVFHGQGVEVWASIEVEPVEMQDFNRVTLLGAVFVDPSGVEPDEVLYRI